MSMFNTRCPKCGVLHDETRYGKYCSLVCERRDHITRQGNTVTGHTSVTLRTPDANPRDKRG